MLLLDTSFLVEFEDELASERPGPASALLSARRKTPVAISIITLREFAEGFLDPVALNEFLMPFRIVQLSRMIAHSCPFESMPTSLIGSRRRARDNSLERTRCCEPIWRPTSQTAASLISLARACGTSACVLMEKLSLRSDDSNKVSNAIIQDGRIGPWPVAVWLYWARRQPVGQAD
jgi:hypothetical protein